MPPRQKAKSKKSTKTHRRASTRSRRSRSRSRHSRRSRSRSRSRHSRRRQSQQQGGFWLKDLIFGRKKSITNVAPATTSRNSFLVPYQIVEQSGQELMLNHEAKTAAQKVLEEKKKQANADLQKAIENVQKTADNYANVMRKKQEYQNAALYIAKVAEGYKQPTTTNSKSALNTTNWNKQIQQLEQQIKQQNEQIYQLQLRVAAAAQKP
jgi:hypothetical protein